MSEFAMKLHLHVRKCHNDRFDQAMCKSTEFLVPLRPKTTITTKHYHSMKKLSFFAAVFTALIFASCEKKETSITADFEDVTLNAEGYLNDQTFTSAGLTFTNVYNKEYGSWDGFAASSQTNTDSTGFSNQYSVITGKAFSGTRFGIAYQGMETPTINCTNSVKLQSLRITNGTYPYFSMLNGDAYCKKFADGDWFKVTITGLDADKNETGKVEVYLADFRNGKSEILKEWRLVDLKALGECSSVTFTFDSTDVGDWGVNTPKYAFIDDIVYE